MSFYMVKKSTESTPYVLIDEKNHCMTLEGMSFHENTVEFFHEIVAWLGGYLETDFTTFTFDCKMKYFNSSTTKILFDMFELMNEHCVDDKEIVVNWNVNKEDEMLIELCDDIKDDYDNLTVNLIMI